MVHSQPQLLQQPLDPGDVVYTPDWVAQDMVYHLDPHGSILEPCRGQGVFMKYLPADARWCEINEGRDFFAWHEPVDWIISNPPFSSSIMTTWFEHSFEIADNVAYLLPIHWVFRASNRIKLIKKYGWIKHVRFYGVGNDLGFNFGNPVACMYFKRGYMASTSWSWYIGPHKLGE